MDKTGPSLERFLTHGGRRRGATLRAVDVQRGQEAACDSATRSRCGSTRSSRGPAVSRLPERATRRCGRFSVCRSCCAASRSGTCTSPRRTAAAPSRDEDEELTQLLAAQAAVAIENARLYEILDPLAAPARVSRRDRRRSRRERSSSSRSSLSSRVGSATWSSAPPRPDCTSHSPTATVSRSPRQTETQTTRAASRGSSSSSVAPRPDGCSSAGGSERVDFVLDDPELDQQVAGRMGVRSALYVPLVAEGRSIGVVVRSRQTGRRRHRASATRTSGSRSPSRRELRSQWIPPSGSVGTPFAVSSKPSVVERARLARELHDETGQALTSILLGLKSLDDRAAADKRSSRGDRAARARRIDVCKMCGETAVELRPATLDDGKLVPAIERLRDVVRGAVLALPSTSGRISETLVSRPTWRQPSIGSSRRHSRTCSYHASASRVAVRLDRRRDKGDARRARRWEGVRSRRRREKAASAWSACASVPRCSGVT